MAVEEENKQEVFKLYFEKKEKEINPLLNNVLHEIISKGLIGTSGVYSTLSNVICVFLKSISNELYQELKDCEKLSYIMSNDELFINEINNIKIKIKDSTNAIFLHQTNEIIRGKITRKINIYTEDVIKDWDSKAQKEYKSFKQKTKEIITNPDKWVVGLIIAIIGAIVSAVLTTILTNYFYW